jgi:CRP/FNR family transcriptional regulator
MSRMSNNKPPKSTQLTGIPLFQGLSEDAVAMLAGILREKSFSRGENIFSEGDASTGFYILVKGRVKVYKLSQEGKEQILHIVGSRELLGAVSAFSGSPYPAYADAMEKSAAFFFPRAEFMALIQREPAVVMNMMANLSMRLQHFTRMIEDLSLKEVPGRLAAYLLYMCDQSGCTGAVTIDIAKGQLASLLGTIPETLSRILRKLSERGIISVKGRTIVIKNRNALKEIIKGEKTGL